MVSAPFLISIIIFALTLAFYSIISRSLSCISHLSLIRSSHIDIIRTDHITPCLHLHWAFICIQSLFDGFFCGKEGVPSLTKDGALLGIDHGVIQFALCVSYAFESDVPVL